jgi:hypothetical protein
LNTDGEHPAQALAPPDCFANTSIRAGGLQRRLDVVEFFELATALGVDPMALFERIARW